MANTVVELYGGQDFIIHEEDYRTTRIEATLTNSEAVARAFQGGTALTGVGAAKAPHTNDAGVTDVTGILVHSTGVMAASGTQKVAVLVKGPAVVDGTSIFDLTGAALDAEGLVEVAALGITLAKNAALIEEGKPAI